MQAIQPSLQMKSIVPNSKYQTPQALLTMTLATLPLYPSTDKPLYHSSAVSYYTLNHSDNHMYQLLKHNKISAFNINNDPQSAYAHHILQNVKEYGSITDTVSILKPIHKTSMSIPYEQLLIQTFHHNGNLITEQDTGEQNPLFQLAMDTMLTPETT